MFFDRRSLCSVWLTALLVASCGPANPMMEMPDLAPPPVPKVEIAVKGTGTGQGIITSMPDGISCGVTCSSTFPVGQPVTIVASPDFRSSFEGFRGGCKGMKCILTPDSTDLIDIYATFRQLACMPGSAMGCTMCNAYSSWVPGNGTASCGPDGVWGMCEKATRNYRSIGHAEINHNCGSANGDGTWSCPMTKSGLYFNTYSKSIYTGKYRISGPSMIVRIDDPTPYAFVTMYLSAYRNGSQVGSIGRVYSPSTRFDQGLPSLALDNIEALDGCQNFYFVIYTYSDRGTMEFKNISGFDVRPM